MIYSTISKDFNFYEPIFSSIGEPPLTLKEIFNPRGIIFGLKLAKKSKWRRCK